MKSFLFPVGLFLLPFYISIINYSKFINVFIINYIVNIIINYIIHYKNLYILQKINNFMIRDNIINKKTEQTILDEITKLFEKYNLSGIVKIPDGGVFTLYSSLGDKLILLEQANQEINRRTKEVEGNINFNVSTEPEKVKDITYIR